MLDSDILCLSHLRWNFVFQRPNHLMMRAARERRVFFMEEPVETDGVPGLDITCPLPAVPNLSVVVPRVTRGASAEEARRQHRALVDLLVAEKSISRPLLWLYTPMALAVARHLEASLVVYDCMDELSQFDSAPPELRAFEAELFTRADVVFTGGQSLYEAKRNHHRNVHAFPSSVDVAHFGRGRRDVQEPGDQAGIAHPRIGFFGVIDETVRAPRAGSHRRRRCRVLPRARCRARRAGGTAHRVLRHHARGYVVGPHLERDASAPRQRRGVVTS